MSGGDDSRRSLPGQPSIESRPGREEPLDLDEELRHLDVRSTLSSVAGDTSTIDPPRGEWLPAPAGDGGDGGDRYEVIRLLGEGGIGKVYLAYDRDLRRQVALKTLRPSRHPHQAEFLDEAQVTGRLQHPNVLPVYELGRSRDRRLYYTMPVVQGLTLREILAALAAGEPATARRYSLTRLIQILIQVAQAVDYAHSRGVAHCDLKPANVMLGAHGEVLVLDWGLSRPLSRREEIASAEGEMPRPVSGTPAYMSPEQASGRTLDARSDVYTLGVLLYEVLTLQLPFEGSRSEVIAGHIHEPPPPPRLRAPDRSIPAALERLCLQALSKHAGDRVGSAAEFHERLQAWIEGESDRVKRQERAEEKVAEGRQQLEAYRRLSRSVRALAREELELARRYKGWQTIEEKEPLFQLQARIEHESSALDETASGLVTTLTQALAFEADNRHARELIADYYWERFVELESAGDLRGRDFFGRLVAAYHDGKYLRQLRGEGSIAFDSDPPGAEVSLCEIGEERLRLRPGRERRLGTTPLGPLPLALGSYLATLRRDGYRDVLYPIHISRNRDWTGRLRLYRDEEIGPGFVHVPAGPFLAGGGEAAPAPAEVEVGDFFIAEHPVTVSEYVRFLEDLGERERMLRSPRRSPDGGSYLERRADGRLALPVVDAEGDRWDPEWPVFGISWFDAVAYCAWLSARLGWDLRLPSELEWEKAARGVDGRLFPWGNRFDPALTNVGDSRRTSAPVRVDALPHDRSVYRVSGMAGNVRTWTSTRLAEAGEEARESPVVRGGAWNDLRFRPRCSDRYWRPPTAVFDTVGIRLARTPAPAAR